MTAIKDLRIKKGLSQQKLAEMMGTTQAAVGLWETGLRTPRAEKLPKLAEILECNIADLFEKKECKE